MPRREGIGGVADDAVRIIQERPAIAVGALAGGLLLAAAVSRRTAPPPPAADGAAAADSRTLTPDVPPPTLTTGAGGGGATPAAPALDLGTILGAILGAQQAGSQQGSELGASGLQAGVELGGAGLRAGTELGYAGLQAGQELGLGGLQVAGTSVDVLGSALGTSVEAQAYQTVGVTDTLGGVVTKLTDVFAGKTPPWWAPRPQPIAAKPAPKPIVRPVVKPAPKPIVRPVVKPAPKPVATKAGPTQVSRSRAGTLIAVRTARPSGNPRLGLVAR